jgi:hypothetical protein
MRDMRAWVDDVAPEDVAATIRFLERSGYLLAPTSVSPSFDNIQLRFSGEFVVVITRDRGQWMLDVIVTDGETYQLDLIAAGRAGHYPTAPADGMPDQIPPWISWNEELPGLLEWLKSPGAGDSIRAASEERYVLMWPDSHKAKTIRARWKKEGVNTSR